MALTIEHPDADRLARELADATGEPLATAVLGAIRERLAREAHSDSERARSEIARIQARLAEAPVLDSRSDDEIVGYDAHGLPA